MSELEFSQDVWSSPFEIPETGQPPAGSADFAEIERCEFPDFTFRPIGAIAGSVSPLRTPTPPPDLFCHELLSPSATPVAEEEGSEAGGASARGSYAKHWCFTLNHHTDDDFLHLACLVDPDAPGDCRYLVMGREVGEGGTPHLQGYLELNAKKRLTWLRTHVNQRAHFEVRRGQREEARDYCMKDGDWLEVGEWKEEERGRRRDIEIMVEQASEGVTFYQASLAHPTTAQFAHSYAKLLEGRALEQTPGWRNVEVIVKIGPTGCGKTRAVFDRHWPDLFVHDCSIGREMWWDGYNGHTAMLLDDFDGKSIPFRYLLRLLDGYPIRLAVKGAHTYGVWTTVYITSNVPVLDWYRREDDISPLMRRISRVERFDGRGDVTVYLHDDHSDAFL